MNEIYEDAKILGEYLLFHYGSDDDVLPGEAWPPGMREALGFARRTPRHFTSSGGKRGLDIGCAVGRATFEMSEFCEEVIGIDYSNAFIAAAEKLRGGETISYARMDEGHLTTNLIAKAPQGVPIDRISFRQGDAMNLPENLGKFDLVHAANLICRLSNPSMLLNRLPSLVNTGGELVLATPCTWLEEFTPSAEWPEQDTLSWLERALGGDFSLLAVNDEPFLIRETARKFQWTKSMVSVWKRN
ncbi:putative 4-mercaptohistidine N1-methyltransferase [Luteolibacter sp. AS25]|uniref:putative 4-mercaptohistidine N1-methyltransferase n=1 Tax=Luteolibacter sp. AS25 TaxID=3135776 RepID=UPI00398B197F